MEPEKAASQEGVCNEDHDRRAEEDGQGEERGIVTGFDPLDGDRDAGTPGTGEGDAETSYPPVAPPAAVSVQAGSLDWPPPPPTTAPMPPPPMPPPPMPPPVGSGKPLPILVELPERATQRRWTVLLRGILVLPLAVVVLVVYAGTLVCVIVGWFAALFVGRAPAFVRTIVAVFLRLGLRLFAYGFLLTDRFPPFSVEEVLDYQVALAVPPATKLNRAAVLFRYFLVIPASILVGLAIYGLVFISIAGWVAALITGWLPKTFHDAYRACGRYQARVFGYFYLLVPTYPEALFGEQAVQAAPTPPTPPTQAVEPGVNVAEIPAPPRDRWQLVLGKGARRVLTIAIILGVPLVIAANVLPVALNTTSSDQQALVQANNQLVGAFNQYTSTAKNCASVSCVEQADQVLSQQIGTFVSAVQGSSASDTGVSADVLSQMTQASQNAERAMAAVADGGPTLADYRSVAARVHVEQVLNTLAQQQSRFSTALNNA